VANERLTENIVRKHFAQYPDGVIVEEQVTTDPAVSKALKVASKHGAGQGRPEFIVRYAQRLDIVLLAECKASKAHHISPRLQSGQPSTVADIGTYACDGVLHYARHLAATHNVIGVAISGESADSARISTYVWLKGTDKPAPLLDLAGKPTDRLRSPADYLKLLLNDPSVLARNVDDLLSLSRQIHNFLRDYAKVTEAEKPLVISAILLALGNPPFRTSWKVASDSDLPQFMFEAIQKVVAKAMPDAARRELMTAAYGFLVTHPELNKLNWLAIKGRPRVRSSPLRYLIGEIQDNVLPFAETYDHIDVIGQFYAEFLRYTGGDGRGLGIVLTPRHLTELFVQIAEVSVADTVLDPCAGTGGFLISAMAEMDRQIGDDAERKTEVRVAQLIGIEQQPQMFALCASNMMLRGDGKSNLHRGDCFDPKLQRSIIRGSAAVRQPNKGLLNPPYSQKGEEQHELDFVKAMMDMLAPGGIGVAVVPMSCVIARHAARERLLGAHTLVAVMSLPDELFYPVGVIPNAVVLKAHTPHAQSASPTWFGYWKDDGFVKVKHLGRVDLDHRWTSVRDTWINDFRARAATPGRCVQRQVTVDDEWCAEAYMETDYSALNKEDFERVLRAHAAFVLTGGTADSA
jgi:type I restriction enzyme M protein